jgi:hypothetical protein
MGAIAQYNNRQRINSFRAIMMPRLWGQRLLLLKLCKYPFTITIESNRIYSGRSLSGIYQQQFEHFEKLYLKLESQFGQINSKREVKN